MFLMKFLINTFSNCLYFQFVFFYVFQCVIKSYLQWLQDSDYNPNCSLCNHVLSDEQYGDCVRLTCYGEYMNIIM